MSNPARIYEYEKCDTCRKALKFLRDHGIEHERVPVVERPPSLAELKRMLECVGGELRKLFNTSGQVYRELKLGEKLPAMSEKEALGLLAANGRLVKRPFLLSGKIGLVGFREQEWMAAFGR